jgi:hypothetical protein
MKTKPTTLLMTKSLRRLAREAFRLAQEPLQAYTCSTSRHDFTQS